MFYQVTKQFLKDVKLWTNLNKLETKLEEAKALFFPGIMSRARYILQMKERI
jgi:hypothetical protein